MPFHLERFSNNAITTLADTITNSDTTIHVDNPANFPAQGPFTIIIDDELIRISSRSGAYFTVAERGAEGTSPAGHTTGVVLAHVLTKATFLSAFENSGPVECRLSFDANDAFQQAGSGGTVYVVPAKGNRLSLLDLTDGHWRLCAVESGVPVDLSGFSSGSLVDVFAAYDAANDRVVGDAKAWSTGTNRNVSYELVPGSGAEVRADNHGYRYLGTLAMWNDGVGISTPKRRFLWNRYNQEDMPLFHAHPFTTYSYGTNTVRQLNNDPDERVEFVVGLSGVSYYEVNGSVSLFQNAAAGTYYYTLGFGVDSTAAFGGKTYPAAYPYFSFAQPVAFHSDRPDKGKHYVQLLEKATNTVTVYGTSAGEHKNGIYGRIRC